MRRIDTLGLLVGMAVSLTLGSPAMITPAASIPQSAPDCSDYATTTEWHGRACPDICVAPGSPLCPKYACPSSLASCGSGSTLTTLHMAAPTSVIASVLTGCSVKVTAERGCAVCGCLACPRCVAKSPYS